MGTRCLFLVLVALAAGCGGDGTECPPIDTSYQPTIDPAAFVAAVDNPLYPLAPGTKLTYQEGESSVVEVVVLSETKVILGVTCTTVHDTVTLSGELIEDTYDWYAQDVDGNVWYFGEDTKEYRGGKVVSTEGSWEAGVDGALPGLIIPATPTVGQTFRQEYYACQAEDMGEILALSESVDVAYGSFTGCLKTHDYTPLDSTANEQKYYCPGVGLVLTIDVTTGEREELLSVE
jgi:hypothetical protein